MPPIPTAHKVAGPGEAGPRKRGRAGDAAGEEFSSAPRRSASGAARPQTPKGRLTKDDILKEQIGRMYYMIGAMVKPLGRFYPVMEKVGENCQEVAPDAAEAWMDLARKDSKVKDALEKMVGASAWGNVIGIHLVIFATALPGGEFMSQMTNSDEYASAEQEAMEKLKGMGLSDEDIEQAMRAVRQEFGQGDPLPDLPVQGNGTPWTEPPSSAIQTPDEQGAVNTDSPPIVEDGT